MITCPECKREYERDTYLGILRESIKSQRNTRPFCSHCQKRLHGNLFRRVYTYTSQ